MDRRKANWFAVGVRTGSEEKAVKCLAKSVNSDEYWVGFIEKEGHLRKDGKIIVQNMKAFPGYIFIVAEKDSETVRRTFQPTMNVERALMWFLHYGSNPEDITMHDDDKDMLCSLLNDNFVIEAIEVIEVGERIEIVSGLFGAVEAVIKKVDRRKESLLAEFWWFGKRVEEWFGFRYAK